MRSRVKMRRTTALHMDIIPYDQRDERIIYEMIVEGWHPLDVATAYGWLVKGRPLARILGSPLVEKSREDSKYRNYRLAVTPVPSTRKKYQHFSVDDKQDAVWLADAGWHMQDISIMLGMRVFRRRDGCIVTDLYDRIKRWREVVYEFFDGD